VPVALRPAVPPGVPARRGSRWLALCGVVLVVLAGLAWTDLRWDGGTTIVLDAAGQPGPARLGEAATLLRQRLATAGYADPRATVTGPRTVTVRVRGAADPAALRALAAPGVFSLRAVLAGPVVPDPPAAGGQRTDAAPDLPALQAKLGPAYDLAVRITDPSQLDTERAARLAPLRTLTADEVALLPAQAQYGIPAIRCDQLGAGQDPGPLTACQAGMGKYLLGVAGVERADLARVTAVLAPHPGWSVALSWTPPGRARWTRLLDLVRDGPVSRVALVLDRTVVAAPALDDAGTTDGLFTEQGMDQPGATRLAALIGTGPLPVTFAVRETDN
jgi:hypothetical protein